MKQEDLNKVNELISQRKDIVDALSFSGLHKTISRPEVQFSHNFNEYYKKILKDKLDDTIVDLCRTELLQQLHLIENAIVEYIPDFERYSITEWM